MQVYPCITQAYRCITQSHQGGITMGIVTTSPRRRPLTRLRTATLVIATALFGAVLAISPVGVSPASAAETIAQCDDALNAAAAEIRCSVTVENSLDRATGVESSIVTVVQCFGAPASFTCTPPVVSAFSSVTSTVDQCNRSANAGGSVVRCSVTVTNVVTNASEIDQASVTPATVNQCSGSGAGGTDPIGDPLNCDRYETTTSATITQCNGSGNGGGGPTRVNCSVGPSTQTALVPITVNQCNGTANGAGDLIFCDVRLVNDVRLAVVVPELPPVPGDGTPVTPGAPGTPVVPGTPDGGGGSGEGTPGAGSPDRGDQRLLAATGTEPQLPAALGLLALGLGGALLLSANARRARSLQR
jgi:hypothetical protein